MNPLDASPAGRLAATTWCLHARVDVLPWWSWIISCHRQAMLPALPGRTLTLQ